MWMPNFLTLNLFYPTNFDNGAHQPFGKKQENKNDEPILSTSGTERFEAMNCLKLDSQP